jgi:hypothetical protein
MKRLLSTFTKGALAVLLVSLIATPARAEFVVKSATGPFTPSFRADANATWFGYSNGTFFGQPVPSAATRILDNTPPTLGNVGLADGVEFYQNDRNDTPFVGIGSSSGNIYTGNMQFGKQAAATMVVPTSGTLGTGFTTLILQGITNTGSPSGAASLILNYPRFEIGGNAATEFVIGINALNQGQWWARFDLPGNQDEYTIDIEFPGGNTTTPISIAGLTVDSYWSASGFAPDTVAVPEPSSLVLLGCGIAGAWLLRRRVGRKA